MSNIRYKRLTAKCRGLKEIPAKLSKIEHGGS
jgi:hypothetical protein